MIKINERTNNVLQIALQRAQKYLYDTKQSFDTCILCCLSTFVKVQLKKNGKDAYAHLIYHNDIKINLQIMMTLLALLTNILCVHS